jgi:hypothetical protein
MPLGAARFGLLGGVADLGKLELIQTNTISASSSTEFTSIQESTYNVHFLTMTNLVTDTATNNTTYMLRFSDDGGTTYEATNYQYANFLINVAGSFVENKSTSANHLFMNFTTNNAASNASATGYSYLYNLGDASKYSFQTHQQMAQTTTNTTQAWFGSGVYTVASTINALEISTSTGETFSGTISLYGIAES